MRPTTVNVAVYMAAIVAALALLIAGVITPAWYWMVLWLVANTSTIALWRYCRRLEDSVMEASALIESLVGGAISAVRCAGCHTAAVLMRGQLPDDDATVPLPPDWALLNERPYCGACAAKSN